jgi:hypothetical protein
MNRPFIIETEKIFSWNDMDGKFDRFLYPLRDRMKFAVQS